MLSLSTSYQNVEFKITNIIMVSSVNVIPLRWGVIFLQNTRVSMWEKVGTADVYRRVDDGYGGSGGSGRCARISAYCSYINWTMVGIFK